MTDMRATERLLEVIDDLGLEVSDLITDVESQAFKKQARLLGAIRELRRRGDTLVRAEDLRRMLSLHRPGSAPADGFTADAWQASVDRLENALGGKP